MQNDPYENGHRGTYTGPINAAGLPHGYGTLTFDCLDAYVGNFVNGRINGEGGYMANDGFNFWGIFEAVG
ncbi:hypothetical protein FACS189449_01140 [Alphaproteobacteria bacterium]|nr:hypothetical protein FACS189449_01140 [Alphaproteobacteria bacterium]